MAEKDESDMEGGDLLPHDHAGIKLDTLGDVKREIARVYRHMRMGGLTTETGNGLTATLNVLASVMQDQRDNIWTKRTRIIWDELQKQKSATSAAQPAKAH